MFGNSKLKLEILRLRDDVSNLKRRVQELERPLLFDIGEYVYLLTGDKPVRAKILDRVKNGFHYFKENCFYEVMEHKYSLLHKGELIHVEERHLSKKKP